jgi:hypothetical protein
MKRPLLIGAGLGGLALIAAGWWLWFPAGSGAKLDTLRADPLALYAPAAVIGGTTPRTYATDEGRPELELGGGPGPGFGDREGATYIRTFLVPRHAGLKPFEAARQAAEHAGWQMDYPDYVTAHSPPERTWTTVRGSKMLPTGDALVFITLDTAVEPWLGSASAARDASSLTIMLEHTR